VIKLFTDSTQADSLPSRCSPALRNPAFFADRIADAPELLSHLFVLLKDVVQRVINFSAHAGAIRWQAHGKSPFLNATSAFSSSVAFKTFAEAVSALILLGPSTTYGLYRGFINPVLIPKPRRM